MELNTNILGIICEYNPFHNGHLYHLLESKEIAGASHTIAIMSGNFAPNDPKTVKAKGQSTPLIDTHSLFHSIDYEIVGA